MLRNHFFSILLMGWCTLMGRVKVVRNAAKYKVKVVHSAPDVYVEKIWWENPSQPGQWKFVDSAPDFTIQYVESGQDFTIAFTSAEPGCP